MAKIAYPFFSNSNGSLLRLRPNKNLKGNFTHVVSINKQAMRKRDENYVSKIQ